MARVQPAFIEQFSSYNVIDLHQPIIFVVDMIEGFLNEGALHDSSIHKITPPIMNLIENVSCRTIFVADEHPKHAREFNSYPPHCLQGTNESNIIGELQPYVREVFHKNSTNAFHCPDFIRFLKEIENYHDFIITGCCSDICILQFALSLQSWLNEHQKINQKIIIPINMIDTYHIDKIHDAILENEFSIRNMAANGIQMVSSIESEKAHG